MGTPFYQDRCFALYTDPPTQEIGWIQTHNEALIVPLTDQVEVLLINFPAEREEPPAYPVRYAGGSSALAPG